MKASELRIGNLFCGDSLGGGYEQITAEEILDFHQDPLDDYYKPIQLTEEWLLKFGFELIKKHKHDFEEFFYGKSIINGCKNHSEQLVISLPLGHSEVGEFIKDESYLMNIEIKYVHQLQNLYFALTGEELQIKD